jgi:hypothetical protein
MRWQVDVVSDVPSGLDQDIVIDAFLEAMERWSACLDRMTVDDESLDCSALGDLGDVEEIRFDVDPSGRIVGESVTLHAASGERIVPTADIAACSQEAWEGLDLRPGAVGGEQVRLRYRDPGTVRPGADGGPPSA